MTVHFPSLDHEQLKNKALRETYLDVKEQAERVPGSVEKVGTLGMFFHANGYYDEALEVYDFLASKENPDGRWSYLAYRILEDFGRRDLAVESLQKSLDRRPEHALTQWRMGELLRKSGQTQNAKNIFESLTNKHPDFAHSFYSLGLMAMRDSKWQEAEHFFNEAIARDSAFVGAYMQLVTVYQNLGNREMAAKAQEFGQSHGIQMEPEDPDIEAMELHGLDPYTLQVRIDYYQAGFRMKNALQLSEILVSSGLAIADDWVQHALILMELGRRDEGVDALDQALELDQKCEQAHLERMKESFVSESRSLTESVIKEAKQALPDSVAINIVAGNIRQNWNELGAAYNDYQMALELDPLSQDARKRLIENRWAAQDWSGAREQLLSWIDENEQSFWNWEKLLNTCIQSGDVVAFHRDLEKARNLYAGEPDKRQKLTELEALMSVHQARESFKSGEIIEGVTNLQLALKLDATCNSALYQLTQHYVEQHKERLAVPYLLAAVDAKADHPLVYRLAAEILFRIGKIEQAKDVAKVGLKISRIDAETFAEYQQLKHLLEHSAF